MREGKGEKETEKEKETTTTRENNDPSIPCALVRVNKRDCDFTLCMPLGGDEEEEEEGSGGVLVGATSKKNEGGAEKGRKRGTQRGRAKMMWAISLHGRELEKRRRGGAADHNDKRARGRKSKEHRMKVEAGRRK